LSFFSHHIATVAGVICQAAQDIKPEEGKIWAGEGFRLHSVRY
jgi:hypothetical protein